MGRGTTLGTSPRVTGRLPRRGGGAAGRVGPWTSRDGVARLSVTLRRPRDAAELRTDLDRLREAGVHRALTVALAPGEQIPFLSAGFRIHEELHLLRRELTTPLPAPPTAARIRRGNRTELDAALTVDRAAFSGIWRLDAGGLEDALRATPARRFAVATVGDAIIGYAITGRAGNRGFLQRLAVVPRHQGQGTGSALVADAVTWLRRRRCREVLVNTQVTNTSALALYLDLGFHLQPEGLAVLAADLTPAGGR